MQEFKKGFLIKIFFLVLVVKFLSCFYLASLTKCAFPELFLGTSLAQFSGDTHSYLAPIDNYLNTGEYFVMHDSVKTGMGRGPYYGSVYFLFRLIFPQHAAYDAVVLLQIILESLSVLILSLLAYRIFKNRFSFYAVLILSLISLNNTCFSIYLFTESFANSFLIFFSYQYYVYLTGRKKSNLRNAAWMLAIAVVLKPYFVLLYVPIAIEVLLNKPFNTRNIFQKGFRIIIPLAIICAPYTIRNYIRFKVIMPVSEMYAGYNYTKATFAYRNFINSWGGSYIFWDKRSAGCYFEIQSGLPCEFVFPDYAFAPGYTMKDIESVRNKFIRYQQQPAPQLEDSVANDFNRLTGIYKQQRPFHYYVLSPLIRMKEYVINSGSYYWPVGPGSACYSGYQFFLKAMQSALYYFTLIFGFIGVTILFFRNRKNIMITFIPFFLLIIFPVFFKSCEFRYFALSYPYLLLGSVMFLQWMAKKIFASKWKNLFLENKNLL